MNKCFENCKYAIVLLSICLPGGGSRKLYCSYGKHGRGIKDTVVCKICHLFEASTNEQAVSEKDKLKEYMSLLSTPEMFAKSHEKLKAFLGVAEPAASEEHGAENVTMEMLCGAIREREKEIAEKEQLAKSINRLADIPADAPKSAEYKLEQVRELIAGIDANPCGSTIKEFVDAMQAVCGIVGVDSKAFDKLRRL